MPLHDYLTRAAEIHSEKDAVVHGNRRIRYGMLSRKVDIAAGFLSRERRVSTGDRVAIIMENSPEYILSYFSVMKAGCIAVPLSDQVTPRGLKRILNDCMPTMLFAQKKLLNMVVECLPDLPFVKTVIVSDAGNMEGRENGEEPDGIYESDKRFIQLARILADENGHNKLPAVDDRDLALILYTSGTTGEPKGVMLTHRNLMANAESIIIYLRLSAADSVMVVLPFYYSYGNSLLTTHFGVAGTLVLENSFMYPNLVLDKMMKEEVTGFSGVPSTFAILLNRSNIRKHSFPRLRYVTQAGGAMSPKHALELREVLPTTQIFIMYGQTEAAARLSYLDPADIVRKAGSIGKAIPGVTLTLKKDESVPCAPGEVGEIVAQGDNIMAGYWNNPLGTTNALREDGLHTGDLAWTDEEGYFYIVGRRTEMIKSGAHRISPKEIEEIILEVPQVHEVAVVGIDDEILGNAIAAFIIPKKEGGLTEEMVVRHCRINLPPFKVPRHVWFVSEFPKTESGKVKKHELSEINASPDRTTSDRKGVSI